MAKIIIIGTGPSGYTAALYAARAGLAPVVFEGGQPGGQLTMTTMVENFPGFPEGIMGPELMDRMKQQAAHFGTTFVQESIVKCDLGKRPFCLESDAGKKYETHTLVVASGASARLLGLPEERALIGRGVSTCATCDGFFYRDKIVHVVGGGDTALEDSMFITKFAKKVYLVHRRDQLRASKIMQEHARKNPKIEFIWNSAVTKIHADEQGVNAITLKNVVSGGALEERATDGLFVAIGHTPNTAFLGGQLTLDENGFIITNHGSKTNIEGVFACGDVQDSHYRQAITSAGSGCMAAIDAEKFLQQLQL
ncbi:MAG: thioredoxin-disulfide reductase [Oligoflexia bacterium]|nr:thioredoxin-disulfide reductase [Oligoflexia bacterium]MBF0367135.1 thioredoxin-disulfide reductase [Oligoflexia bacterium]